MCVILSLITLSLGIRMFIRFYLLPCIHTSKIKSCISPVRNVRGASNYSFFIRPRSVRKTSGKRPRSQLPCQSRRDGDMRLDHSRRKKLEKSNLRIRFKKVWDECGTNVDVLHSKNSEKRRKESKMRLHRKLTYRNYCKSFN